MYLNKEQIEFLKGLIYLSKGEIKDLIGGFTSIEVLLDIDDIKKFEEINQQN